MTEWGPKARNGLRANDADAFCRCNSVGLVPGVPVHALNAGISVLPHHQAARFVGGIHVPPVDGWLGAVQPMSL